MFLSHIPIYLLSCCATAGKVLLMGAVLSSSLSPGSHPQSHPGPDRGAQELPGTKRYHLTAPGAVVPSSRQNEEQF